MTFEIHQATAADAPDLLATRNEAHAFKLQQNDDAWTQEPFTIEEIEQTIARGATHVASIDGQPAGCVTLIWDDERNWGAPGTDGQAAYIHGLATRDSFRGQGVGAQLIDWCAEQIRQAGRSYVRLDCPTTNEQLCAYYERQGFTRVGINNMGEALYERAV